MPNDDLSEEEISISHKENELTEEEHYLGSKEGGKGTDAEFIRYATDTEKFKIAFYMRFSGWIIKEIPITTSIAGETQVEYKPIKRILKASRIMNESGADFLFGNVEPLISHIAQTSDLSEMYIYTLWRGHITLIILGLLDAYDDKNRYKMRNLDDILNIVSYLCTFSSFTMKAKNGFTLKQATEFIQSATITRLGGEGGIRHEKRGIGERLKAFVKGE